MLYCYHGTDTMSIRRSALNAAHEAGGTLMVIGAESFVSGSLRDAVGSASLFGERSTYVLDTPSADPSFVAEVQTVLESMAVSMDTFVVIEGTLLAADLRRYKKVAAKLEEFSAPAATRFNTFALGDALANRDKKSLWLLLNEARQAGVSSEEVAGILWWQLKALSLAQQTQDAAAAGMKPYPYQKAQRAASRFTKTELTALMERLITIYHEGHAGMTELDLALEQWVLTV